MINEKNNMKYDIYPIELIKTSMSCVRFLRQKPMPYMHQQIIRQLILYCLSKDGDNWFPLNRNYKPIAMSADSWVDYDDFPCLLIPNDRINFDGIEMEPATLNGKATIYIFKDGTFPNNKKNIERYCDVIHKMFFESKNKD